VKWLAAAVGVIVGAAITYLGLFLVGYSGDTGGDADIYVRLRGKRVDADVVGVPLAVGGVIVIVASVLALRRARRASRTG